MRRIATGLVVVVLAVMVPGAATAECTDAGPATVCEFEEGSCAFLYLPDGELADVCATTTGRQSVAGTVYPTPGSSRPRLSFEAGKTPADELYGYGCAEAGEAGSEFDVWTCGAGYYDVGTTNGLALILYGYIVGNGQCYWFFVPVLRPTDRQIEAC